MWVKTISRALVVIAAACAPQSIAAQSIQGRVLDDQNELPVGTALVRLMKEDGEQLAMTVAGSSGFYRIEAEAPGVYRLRKESIIYPASAVLTYTAAWIR